MSITLPPLPYEKDGLAPHISSETIDYHYGKHHAGTSKHGNNMGGMLCSVDKHIADAVLCSVCPLVYRLCDQG